MNLLNSLIGKIQRIDDLPIEATRAVNRSTSWGKANQRAYNAAHQAVPVKPVVPITPSLGQLAGDGPRQRLQVAPQGNLQPSVRPPLQYQPYQASGYGIQNPRMYDQTGLQVGVTMHPLNSPIDPTYGQLPQLNKPLLQHISELY